MDHVTLSSRKILRNRKSGRDKQFAKPGTSLGTLILYHFHSREEPSRLSIATVLRS